MVSTRSSNGARRASVSSAPATKRLAQLGCILAAVVLWQLVSLSGVLSADLLPSVPSVAGPFVTMVPGPDFGQALQHALLVALRGLVVALGVGIRWGILCGLSARPDKATRILIDVGR